MAEFHSFVIIVGKERGCNFGFVPLLLLQMYCCKFNHTLHPGINTIFLCFAKCNCILNRENVMNSVFMSCTRF